MGGIGGNLSQIGGNLYLIVNLFVNGNVKKGERGRKLHVVMNHYFHWWEFGGFGLE